MDMSGSYQNPMVPTTSMTCEAAPIEVWIEIDGKMVSHHAVYYDSSKKEVSCWIESLVDKPFELKYKSISDSTEYAMGVEILLDGKIVRKKFLFPHRPMLVGTVSGALTSPTEERQFKFGTPKLTDDDQYLDNKSSMHIGDIRMVIRKKSDFDPKEEKISSTYDVSEAVIIHEKTKKGLAHIVTYGETKTIEKQVAYKSQNCGILATFIFNYRPREMLQAYGVIRNPGLSGYSHRCPGLAYKPTEAYMKRGWNHDLEDDYDKERTRKNIKLEPATP